MAIHVSFLKQTKAETNVIVTRDLCEWGERNMGWNLPEYNFYKKINEIMLMFYIHKANKQTAKETKLNEQRGGKRKHKTES